MYAGVHIQDARCVGNDMSPRTSQKDGFILTEKEEESIKTNFGVSCREIMRAFLLIMNRRTSQEMSRWCTCERREPIFTMVSNFPLDLRVSFSTTFMDGSFNKSTYIHNMSIDIPGGVHPYTATVYALLTVPQIIIARSMRSSTKEPPHSVAQMTGFDPSSGHSENALIAAGVRLTAEERRV